MDGSWIHSHSFSLSCLSCERANIPRSFPMRCVSNAGQCNNWRGQRASEQRPKQNQSVMHSRKNKILSAGLVGPPRTIFRPANFSPSSSSSSSSAVMRAVRTPERQESRKTFLGSNGGCQSVREEGHRSADRLYVSQSCGKIVDHIGD